MVPSGVTSVIEADLPITTLALEVFVKNGERTFEVLACRVILIAGVAWSPCAAAVRPFCAPGVSKITQH
jgi:hypothetical protein